MSSKIGLLISFVFYALFFTLSIDVMCIQYEYSNLDSVSITISYELSRLEKFDDLSLSKIEDKHNVVISDISNRTPSFGDVIDFTILKEYRPLIVSNNIMEIKVKRTTVIGYY